MSTRDLIPAHLGVETTLTNSSVSASASEYTGVDVDDTADDEHPYLF